MSTTRMWIRNHLPETGYKVNDALGRVGNYYPIPRADLEQDNRLLFERLKNEGVIYWQTIKQGSVLYAWARQPYHFLRLCPYTSSKLESRTSSPWNVSGSNFFSVFALVFQYGELQDGQVTGRPLGPFTRLSHKCPHREHRYTLIVIFISGDNIL
jgi:hypothetical protein